MSRPAGYSMNSRSGESAAGIQKKEKCRRLAISWSQRARISSSGQNSTRSASAKASLTSSSASVMTPRSPSDTCMAASSSGLSPVTSIASPDGRITRKRRPVAEKHCWRIPEPWVAVDMAPTMCWESISPWFFKHSPASQSGSPNSRMRVPDRTVTRLVPGSARTMPLIWSRLISTPSVRQRVEKEWPAPTTRTGSPRLVAEAMISLTSSSVRG